MGTNNRVLFLINGKSRKLKKIKKQLSQTSIKNFDIVVTEKEKTTTKIVEEQGFNYSHLIAIGGDGTIHEAINGLMKLEENKRPVLSVIPAGTANDFAKTLSFPSSVSELSLAIEKGVTRNIDIGEIIFSDEEGKEKKEWFNNIADVGIGAAVVEQVNVQPRGLNANIAFFRAIIKAFRKYKNIPVKCQTEDWTWEGKIKLFVIANGKYFGSGLAIAPDAEPDDGKFAITIGADLSTRDYIRNLPQLKRGKKINHPQLFYKEAKQIKISSSEQCMIEADGEFIGYAPATIKILPKALKVLLK